MKLLIVGADGQLGTELQRILDSRVSEIGPIELPYTPKEVLTTDVDTLDITDSHAVEEYLSQHRPNIIFNCAAYTHVDGAEENPDDAFAVNALGPLYVAKGAKKIGAELVHVSTDYVFSGDIPDRSPYREWDIPNPTSVYGKSKLLGERYVMEQNPSSYIVRTAWLYGYKGGNFVKTILNAAERHPELTIVEDQLGNPTNANDVAYHLLLLPFSGGYGTYHCTNEGICSWYDFALEFLRLAEKEVKVRGVTSEEYPSPTQRPVFSALDNMMLRRTIGNRMRPWQQAIASYIEHLEDK